MTEPEWNPDAETTETVDASAEDADASATDNTPDTDAGEEIVSDDGADDGADADGAAEASA